MKALELSGLRFGRLTALSPTRLGNKRSWLCRCDCDNEVVVPTSQLIGGYTKSCGCLRREHGDLTGHRFGALTVVEEGGYDARNRRAKWRCRCDCGGEIVTFARYLQRGSRVDCGCGDADRHRANGSKRLKPEAYLTAVYHEYRGNAQRRGLPFTLTRDDVKKLVLSPCAYCGAPPSRLLADHKVAVSGIDRRRNGEGYASDNAVACCWPCNAMKREMDEDTLLVHIQRIATKTGRAPAPST